MVTLLKLPSGLNAELTPLAPLMVVAVASCEMSNE